MTDINIPGDDIETARNNMQQVLSLFDSPSANFRNIDAALGNDKSVTAAANDFDKRWNDGRTQLRNEGKSIIDALTKVIDTFTDTDNQIGNQLTAGDS
jgi:uncharacterized phage infection (PIP) family protein YhgE